MGEVIDPLFDVLGTALLNNGLDPEHVGIGRLDDEDTYAVLVISRAIIITAGEPDEKRAIRWQFYEFTGEMLSDCIDPEGIATRVLGQMKDRLGRAW